MRGHIWNPPFYLKHNWGRRKAVLDYGPDRIKTLSMVTDSSLTVIVGENNVATLVFSCLIRSFLFLQA